MADPVNATTSTSVDVEVAGYHLGEYTVRFTATSGPKWKIEDAITKLQLQAPSNVNLKSPEFDVGPFTCNLSIEMRHKQSKWHFGPYIHMIPEESDKVAAWGACTFELLDGEGSLIKSLTFVDGKFEGTHGWGLATFETAEAVLKQVQGTNSEGTDLHLRVKAHAKGVPAQEQEATDAGTQLLTMLAELRVPQIRAHAQSDDALDNSANSTFPSSTGPGSTGTGTLTFGGNSSVLIRMPLVATGEDKAQALQQHMACHQLMLENLCTSFTWNANLNSTDPSVSIIVQHSLVQELPLLQSLQEKTNMIPPHEAEVRGEGNQVSKRNSKKRKSAQMMAPQTQQASTYEVVPFTPPASVSGIACVLMLLEGTVTPQKLFSCGCGPTLAVQTLWAASYLGHKQVEQVVTKWLYCMALSMVAGKDACPSEAPEDIKESVGSIVSSREEWKQVFGLLPLDTLKTIVDDLTALLPGSSFESKVLELPVAIIDQWLDSCNGVISLQSATVPDVACVLKLIDLLPRHPEVAVLHLPKSEGDYFSAEDTAPVLEALDMVLPAIPRLRVLGLTSLTLTNKSVHHVVSILSIVRDRLQGVALPFDNLEVTDILFQAISKMTKLQTLRLDRWEEEIAKERIAGLKPLKVLVEDMLSTEYVVRMAAEAPFLKFCNVPEF